MRLVEVCGLDMWTIKRKSKACLFVDFKNCFLL